MITKTIKESVLRVLENHDGLTGTELALKVLGELGPGNVTNEEYKDALLTLTMNCEIIELQYRRRTKSIIKSVYFHKNVELTLK